MAYKSIDGKMPSGTSTPASTWAARLSALEATSEVAPSEPAPMFFSDTAGVIVSGASSLKGVQIASKRLTAKLGN